MSPNPPPRPRAVRHGRLIYSVACLLALAASQDYAFSGIGNGILRFNAIGRLTYDSNVFGDQSDRSDTIYTLTPQLSFDREGSRGNSHFDLGTSLNRYNKYSELNSNSNWSANGSVELIPGGGRLSGTLDVRYFDGQEVDEFVGRRVDIRRLNFSLDSDYRFSSRTSVRFGATTNRYNTDLRPSASSWSLRAGLARELRPDISTFLDFSHGVSKTGTEVGDTYRADFQSNVLSIGLTGRFNPRISGSASVGYGWYNAGTVDTVGDSSSLVANVTLRWTPRANTQFHITGGRQNRVTSYAESINANTVNLGVTQRLGAALTATGSVIWESFATRGVEHTNNKRVGVALDLQYSIHDRLGFGGGIQHNVRNSPDPRFDISRTTYTVFARYSF